MDEENQTFEESMDEAFESAPSETPAEDPPADPAPTESVEPKPEEPPVDEIAQIEQEIGGYKVATQKRMQTLLGKYKEVATENADLKKQYESFGGAEGVKAALEEREQYQAAFQQLADLGFDDEQAGEDLRQFAMFRKALKSGDMAQAQQILNPFMRQISMHTGAPLQVDGLSGHDDLAQAVQAQQIDPQLAYEIARRRDAEAQMQQHQQVNHQRTQQALQVQQAQEQAYSQIDQISKQWEATDPDFKEIAPLLTPHVEAIVKNFPPNAWAEAVKIQYQQLKQAASKWRQPAPEPRALRGIGNAAGKPVAASFGDAMDQAFGSL